MHKAGVGLVIRFGGCFDGTETVAILLHRKFKWPVGQTVLIFNVIIYSTAAILFGFDRAMYSLLTYFITSKILDIVENGLNQLKAIIDDLDSSTFIAVSDVTEIIGTHMKKSGYLEEFEADVRQAIREIK